MVPPRFLQSTEAQRLRQVEIEHHIRPLKVLVGVALLAGFGLIAPGTPLSDIVPTLALALVYLPVLYVADRRGPRSRAPLVWVAVQDLGAIAILAFGVSWSGGLESAALPGTIPVAILMGTRFPARWLVPLLAITALLLSAGILAAPAGLPGDATVQGFAWLMAFFISSALANMLASAERRARKDAVHDALTGVLNRKALDLRLAEEREDRPARRAETISVIAADLDGFKPVNDRHGHEAGDRVLRAVAAALAEGVRSTDSVYRLGGDEFLVILPGIALPKALEVAERLRGAVGDLRPGGHDIRMSFGVAGVADAPANLDQLIRRADSALYTAKAAGRDQVAAFDAGAPIVLAGV